MLESIGEKLKRVAMACGSDCDPNFDVFIYDVQLFFIAIRQGRNDAFLKGIFTEVLDSYEKLIQCITYHT